MTINIHTVSDAAQSYLAAALAYIAEYDLMNVGAAILLIARLLVDVPPALSYIKHSLTKKPKQRKKKDKNDRSN